MLKDHAGALDDVLKIKPSPFSSGDDVAQQKADIEAALASAAAKPGACTRHPSEKRSRAKKKR